MTELIKEVCFKLIEGVIIIVIVLAFFTDYFNNKGGKHD
jgi:hypothetical protein